MKLGLPRKSSRFTKILLIGLILLVVFVGGAVAVRYVYNQNLRPVAASQKSVVVTIPSGYLTPQIAKLLKEQGLIRSEAAFKRYVKNAEADDDIKAGTYELSPSYSVQEIVAIITEGKIKTNLVTILPGQSIKQVKEAFVKNGFSRESVDEAFNPDLYKNHPALVDKPAKSSLEGYLYPESFQKTESTTPQQIITQSLDEMQKRLTPELRKAISAQNLSVYDGLILSSIVEKEADKPTDRAQVAQVLLLRLRRGMALQADPTAFYGARLDGKPDSVSYDTPYNTYLHLGLPPGPISNISKSSLEAVGSPAQGDFVFYVAGDDGKVHFAHTAEQHQANIDQYCKKLCGKQP